ncbi:MAG: lysine--tRNA ligase [Deltaproteobacteria bacterium]|nr:lysine--tRNA ligase [Deltaproteobacteria bacterium]
MSKEAQGKTEQALGEARRAKAARLRERGENPFANDVTSGEPLSDLGAVRAGCAGARGPDGRYDPGRIEPRTYRVAGRILFLRAMGGVSFVRLRDRTGELQLHLSEAALGAAYAGLDELDLGDFVEATGRAMATRRGELSIDVERFRLLTKAYRPLCTKTSFKDVESRYRMRYVDLVANPAVSDVFRARSMMLSAIRGFLDGRGFIEVETPSMHSLVGGAAARPFRTHHNALDLDLYLRIAPELYLKRLVVGGFERVFEIARCYRNEGVSTRHNPEFTMLEFYQAYATYETLLGLTEDLLRHVDERLGAALPEQHAAWSQARGFSLERFVRVTMRDAVAQALARADLGASVAQQAHLPDAPVGEWAERAGRRGRAIDWAGYRQASQRCATQGERLFCAYEFLAEPFLTEDYRAGERSLPVFVLGYPVEVSPLARKSDADPSQVDRFELFLGGQELCNAFSELNDPDDQAARFEAQVVLKSRGSEEAMDYDHDYVRALEHGMPPTAGFGMGIDRLAMLLTGAPSIREVILFPLLRPGEGA